jgi:RsmE family RNA methyltransferase
VNLLLLTEADRVAGERFRVDAGRAAHIRDILGAEPGRELRVGLLEGPMGRGVVVSCGADECLLDCAFDDAPPPRPAVDLVLAIPRPKSLRKLLPEVAAMGVDRIVLLRTWRVAKPFLTQSALDPAEYRPLLHEGMMQGRTTREPCVSVEPLFKPFVEDRLPAFAAGAQGLVAHPGAGATLASRRIGAADRVVLAIGPEGGFLPYEVDAFGAAGFTAVSIGDRTLRVETACVAILAQIDLLRRIGDR